MTILPSALARGTTETIAEDGMHSWGRELGARAGEISGGRTHPRRRFLGFAAALSVGTCLPKRSWPQDQNTRSFIWRLPAPKQALLENELDFEGTIEPDNDSRGLLVVVVGVAVLVYLARAILRMHDELEGGTVIDVRGEQIVIERAANLPGETILLVTNEGTELHERSEIATPDALAKLLTK